MPDPPTFLSASGPPLIAMILNLRAAAKKN